MHRPHIAQLTCRRAAIGGQDCRCRPRSSSSSTVKPAVFVNSSLAGLGTWVRPVWLGSRAQPWPRTLVIVACSLLTRACHVCCILCRQGSLCWPAAVHLLQQQAANPGGRRTAHHWILHHFFSGCMLALLRVVEHSPTVLLLQSSLAFSAAASTGATAHVHLQLVH